MIEQSKIQNLKCQSRRRNCLTETTRTRCRRATLIKSRSRLRSSSLVTRYRDLPRMAASKISLSSGSRHIFSSPEVCTMLARAAISLTNASISPAGYPNRRINRGLLRTSAISASCERDVTAMRSLRRQAATTCPGGPVGFRKLETQTLVSSRATSGTAFRLDLCPCLSHLCLDHLLRDVFSARLHPLKQAFKFVPPLWLPAQSNQDVGFFFQSEGLEGSQNPVFKHRSKRFLYRISSSRRRHEVDYSRTSALRSTEWVGL